MLVLAMQFSKGKTVGASCFQATHGNEFSPLRCKPLNGDHIAATRKLVKKCVTHSFKTEQRESSQRVRMVKRKTCYSHSRDDGQLVSDQLGVPSAPLNKRQ